MEIKSSRRLRAERRVDLHAIDATRAPDALFDFHTDKHPWKSHARTNLRRAFSGSSSRLHVAARLAAYVFHSERFCTRSTEWIVKAPVRKINQ